MTVRFIRSGNPGGRRRALAVLFCILLSGLSPAASADADLAIGKIGTPNPVNPGNSLTYTLTVTNNGPDTAENVVVTDTLPSGVQLVKADDSCAESPNQPGTLICSLGSLAAKGEVALGIEVVPSPNTQGTILNLASVDSDEPDPNPNDNVAEAAVEVEPETADLEIEKMTSPNPVTAGGLLNYTINVTNNGPDSAHNVFVTDDLPAGLQFVSSNSGCSVISDNSLVCNLGTLAAGAMAQPIMITVQTPATLQGQITNTASVGSSTLDNDSSNNQSSATTQIQPPVTEASADLSLSKSASVWQITPGYSFDYRLTVSNQGPNTAQGVILFDPLPQGLRLLGASTSCTGQTNVICTLGNVDVGAGVTVVLTVQADTTVSGTLNNTAAVASESTPDPTSGNNLASVDVSVSDAPPEPCGALSLLPTDTLLPSAFVGQSFSIQFNGSCGVSPREISGANAPPGLGFFAVAGSDASIELRGVPTQAGNFIITVTLSDSADPASTLVRNYQMSIGAALDIRPLSLPVTQVGENFITTFMTANGIPPDSFTSSDPLPPGLALNGNSLTGMPTQVGDFSFTIGAMDAAGNRGTRDYTLRVLPAGLLILTDTLPNAVVNESYGSQVLAIGGVKPYRWRVDSALPDGLTFSDSGFFSGRPTETGNFTVTVTVQDQSGAETSADLTLLVIPTGLVNLTPEIFPNGLLGAPYNVPILIEGGNPPYFVFTLGLPARPGIGLAAREAGNAPRLSGKGKENPEQAHIMQLDKKWQKAGSRYKLKNLLKQWLKLKRHFAITGLPQGLRISKDGTAIVGTPLEAGTFRFAIIAWDRSRPPLRIRSEHVIQILE